MRAPRTGDEAGGSDPSREEPAAWCSPVRPTATPASTATTAIPATAHTHFGGRGQPPNSTTSSDGTTHPRLMLRRGGPCALAGQPACYDLSYVFAGLRCAAIRPEHVRDIRGPLVVGLATDEHPREYQRSERLLEDQFQREPGLALLRRPIHPVGV